MLRNRYFYCFPADFVPDLLMSSPVPSPSALSSEGQNIPSGAPCLPSEVTSWDLR